MQQKALPSLQGRYLPPAQHEPAGIGVVAALLVGPLLVLTVVRVGLLLKEKERTKKERLKVEKEQELVPKAPETAWERAVPSLSPLSAQ